MIAEKASIITTPGNETVVRDAARRCFVRVQDRLRTWNQEPVVELINHRFELQDSTNQLVAIDIGSPADSTDEFVVYWFPRQRLLFEMEHGWERKGKLRAAVGARHLLQALREQGIAPTRIVQAYPILDLPSELSRVKLQALARAR